MNLFDYPHRMWGVDNHSGHGFSLQVKDRNYDADPGGRVNGFDYGPVSNHKLVDLLANLIFADGLFRSSDQLPRWPSAAELWLHIRRRGPRIVPTLESQRRRGWRQPSHE